MENWEWRSDEVSGDRNVIFGAWGWRRRLGFAAGRKYLRVRGSGGSSREGDAPTMPLPPKKFVSRLYMCMLPPMPLLAPSTLPMSSAMTSRGVPPRPRCVQ